MSGSLAWQDYTDDLGRHWAYNLDESNARARIFLFNQGIVDIYTLPIAPFPGRPPRGLVPRYVSTVNTSIVSLRRDFVIMSRTVFNRLITDPEVFMVTGSGSQQSDYWSIVGLYNERYPSKPNYFIDTGLTDGDSRVPRA
jgi:hypothetical protein